MQSKIQGKKIIPLSEVKRFIIECTQKVGAPKPQAEAMADVLAEADYRGHYSHGINRLELYMRDFISGICDSKAEPVIVSQRPATALVDGKNGVGAYVSRFCMDLAIKKAKEVGVGIVSCRGSNHNGIVSMYAVQALKEGLIGMSFSNTSPLMSPPNAKKAALGTNPLACAAPGEKGDSIVLDMATTAVALGKIEIATLKGNKIAAGWAKGPDGKITTEADVALKNAALMPLGATEFDSGHKGYGLALLVEILCGILSGSDYGSNISSWKKRVKPANLGHCFIAIDVKGFEPGFEGRLSDLIKILHNLEPVDPTCPVLVPGDPERMHMAEVDKNGGIQYMMKLIDRYKRVAATHQVQEMQPLKNSN